MYQVLGSRWLDSSCRIRTQLPLAFDFEQTCDTLQRPKQPFQALNLHHQGQSCTMRLRSKSDPLADHLRASPVDQQRLVSRRQLWRTTNYFYHSQSASVCLALQQSNKKVFLGCRSQFAPIPGGYDQLARRRLFFPTSSSYLTFVCLIACPQSFDATALLSYCQCHTRVRTKASRPKRLVSKRTACHQVLQAPPPRQPLLRISNDQALESRTSGFACKAIGSVMRVIACYRHQISYLETWTRGPAVRPMEPMRPMLTYHLDGRYTL
jgi:hypothetical protein